MVSADDIPGKGNQIKSHLAQQVKSHTIRDGEGRPILIFVAAVDAKEGDVCTCTELQYYGSGNQQVKFMQEREYKWKDAWNNGIFDPTVDYDPDGDGDL